LPANAPQGITIGPDGDLYVANGGDNTIVRYNLQTGASWACLPRPRHPDGPHLRSQWRPVVCSWGTGVIYKFDGKTGANLGIFASGDLTNPSPIAFGPDGNLYVGGFGSSNVVNHTERIMNREAPAPAEGWSCSRFLTRNTAGFPTKYQVSGARHFS